MMQVYLARADWVAGIAFFVAFVLTCWPKRWSLVSAVALYIIGTLTSLGMKAYSYFMAFAIGWGMSDGPPESFPIFGWVLPLWILGYGIAACVLLLPWIPRRRALFLAKITHLGILPPLVIILMIGEYQQIHRFMPYSLSWLVYGLLWFRIRDGEPVPLKES
jgi:hypothetical protein